MKTIVWDVDDVLNDMMRCWLTDYAARSGSGHGLRYEEITENPPHRLLGISRERYLSLLDEFRVSPAGREMAPVPEAMDWFKRYGRRFRHIALTARPQATVGEAARWVLSHFGEWIRTFHFVPADRPGQERVLYDKDKSDVLRWLDKGDLFVDDNENNVEGARGLGMTALLIPRPWNRGRASVREAFDALTRAALGSDCLKKP